MLPRYRQIRSRHAASDTQRERRGSQMGFDDHISTARVELDRAGAGLLDRRGHQPYPGGWSVVARLKVFLG